MGNDDSDSDLAVQRPPKRTQAKPVDAGSDSDLAVQRPPKHKQSKKADAGSDSDLAVQRLPKHSKLKQTADSDSDLPVERPVRQKKSKQADGSDSDLAVQRPSTKQKKRKANGSAGSDSDLAVPRPSKHKKTKQAAGSDSDLAVERPSKSKKSKPEKVQMKLEKSARKLKEQPDDDLELDRQPMKREVPSPPRPSERRENDVLPSRMLEPSRSRDGLGSGFGFGPGPDGPKGEKGEKGKGKGKGKEDGNEQPKEQPNFEPSGLLALEDNAKNGIPLKFTVPSEVRRPATKWRLYVFTKATEAPKIIPIHKEVGYLFGKDRRVAEVPTDHPTCSKQHAVLHYRQTKSGLVKPYIMDLESVNGTFVNGERIEASRYYELKEKDVLKFGMSTREFVLLHGGSANHMSIDPKDLRSPSEG